MNRRTPAATVAVAALSLALVLTLGGCARLVNAGLGMLGSGNGDPTAVGQPGLTDRRGPGSPAATSAYQVAPTLDLRGLAWGRPHSVARSIVSGPNASLPGCQFVPRGMTEVAHVAFGAPGAELGRTGPLVYGVGGYAADAVAQLFRGPSAEGLGWSSLRGAAWHATSGNACGYEVFFYLGLAGSKGTEPVSVLR